MRAIAGERGAGVGAQWRDPGALTPPACSGEPAWQVTVEDADRCDRFSMIALEGLDPTAPSPWWLRRRLAQSAVRSISLAVRSEEHTSELQSRPYLVCRLLLEKKTRPRSDANSR